MQVQNKKLGKGSQTSIGKKGRMIPHQQVAPTAGTFKGLVQEENLLFWQERLHLFLDTLDELGARLSQTFSFEDLLVYKKLLGGFLEDSLTQIYGLKKETGWSAAGRPKLYQRIELLNQEVEELTQIVLKKQGDCVQILAKLDSIRGILVDLYS